MVRVRINKDDKQPERPEREPESDVVIREDDGDGQEAAEPPKRRDEKPAGPKVGAWRGMSERQWFISLLVASGLLLLIAFRGCVLPSGIGPKPEADGPPAATATAAPTPAATDQASGDTYTVQSGDTLGKIARQFDTTAEAIAEANDITTTTTLRVGQELEIP